MGVSDTSDHTQIIIKMPNPSQEHPASSKPPNGDLKDMDVLCTFKINIESQKSYYGYMREQWQYPNHDEDIKHQSRTSSILQSPKLGLKGHAKSLHLQNWQTEPYFGKSVSKTNNHIQIFIKMPNPSQAPASSKTPHQDFKDMDVLCTFRIEIESQNLEQGFTKDQWPYPN